MNSETAQSLSIVVPVYNEEDNVHPLVDRYTMLCKIMLTHGN